MPNYSYLARNQGGTIERGVQEAASPQALRTALERRGLRLMSVEENQGLGAASVDFSVLSPSRWLPPASLDIELALTQLAVMLRAGVPLLGSLRTSADQARRHSTAMLLNRVADRIQEGESFAEALTAEKRIPPLVIQLVKVGEQTGTLELVLERASKQLERRRLLLTQLMTALAYPALVLVAAIAITIYLIVVVIPELQKFLAALGRELPAMTQNLLDISTFVQTYGIQILVGIAIGIVASILLYLWPPSRFVIDRIMLRIPIIGPVFRLAGTAAFSSSMSVLLRSGITVLEALRTVEQLHANRYLRDVLTRARDSVIQGSSLATPLATKWAYMPMLPKMIAVAESTGELDEILEHVAKFHEDQLQASIRRLSALIEPAIIMVIGAIVGYVYIAFFVALFAAGGNFS